MDKQDINYDELRTIPLSTLQRWYDEIKPIQPTLIDTVHIPVLRRQSSIFSRQGTNAIRKTASYLRPVLIIVDGDDFVIGEVRLSFFSSSEWLRIGISPDSLVALATPYMIIRMYDTYRLVPVTPLLVNNDVDNESLSLFIQGSTILRIVSDSNQHTGAKLRETDRNAHATSVVLMARIVAKRFRSPLYGDFVSAIDSAIQTRDVRILHQAIQELSSDALGRLFALVWSASQERGSRIGGNMN